MQPQKKKEKRKKKRVLALVQIFAQKKEKGVVPYTSAFCKDLDYRNWKNKIKIKRKRIKMNKNKHKSA
jgi:hypothetical protein